MTPRTPPALSLVIATRRDAACRTHPLRRALAAIAAAEQPAGGIEVLVVDQGDDERVARIIAEPALRGLHVRHVRVGWVNADRARNLGASLARAPWLAFPDDDAAYAPDALVRAVGLIAAEPAALLVGGCLVDDLDRPHQVAWPSDSRPITTATTTSTTIETTVFVQRERFLAVGGFDTRFGPGGRYHSGELLELLQRMAPLDGALGRFDPAIRVGHARRPLTADAAERRRIHRYAVGVGAAAAAHPGSPLDVAVRRSMRRAAASLVVPLPGRRPLRVRAARLSGLVIGYARSRWDGVR